MRWLVALAVTCACASAPVKPPAAKGDTEAQSADPAALRDELALTVLESYRAVGADYAEAYQDSLGRGARIVLIDVRPDDVVVGFDLERALRIRRYFDAESRVDVVSQELEARLAADAKVGWVHDHLSYRVGRGRRTAILPLRSSAVYERGEGRWLKVAEHVSYAQSREELEADARADRLAAPVRIPASVSGPDAEQAAAVARTTFADGENAFASDALVIPPWSAAETRGQPLSIASLFGSGVTVREEALRADLSPTKTVAWIAGNVVVQGPGWEIPLRATWVLERRSEAFQVVQVHLSAAISQEKLARALFGE